MQKKKSFHILVAIILLLTGCQNRSGNQAINTGISGSATNTISTGTTGNSNATPSPVSNQINIKDYFPIQKDIKYTYKGSGNEFASYTVYIDYTGEDKIQQRINNGGTETVKVLELKSGKLTQIFSRGEVYYRENFLNVTEREQEVYLMEPLIVGNSWTLSNSRKRTITNTAADVTTPMGSYKAIEVTTDSAEGKNLEYYVKNIGLIKSVYKSGGIEVSSTLDNIKNNVTEKAELNFYYPVKDSGKLHYISKKIDFKTNDVTKKIIEQTYKEIAKHKLGRPIPADLKINSLYLNKDKMVYLDLNSAFIAEINKQKPYEKLILQSIANTFGSYYGSDKVILTIDNKTYKSENITMKKGEYLKVDISGSIKDQQ